MSNRIKKLSESPCYKCHYEWECDEKIKRIPILAEIRDSVFPNAEYDYHDCPLWIALNAPEMMEVDE